MFRYVGSKPVTYRSTETVCNVGVELLIKSFTGFARPIRSKDCCSQKAGPAADQRVYFFSLSHL